MQILTDIMEDYGINSIKLYQRENTVYVSYDSDYSEEQLLDIFESMGIQRGIITIERNNGFATEATASTIPASSEINIKHGTTCSATVGFNAQRSGTWDYGIVTAGHLISSPEISPSTTITYNGKVINTKGACKISNKQKSNNDCAFIPFASSNSWASTQVFSIPGKFGFIDDYTYPAYQLENRTVYKYGINEKREYAGTLTSVSCTIPINADALGNPSAIKTDMFQCKVLNFSGDSGGPIGFLSGSTSPYKLSIIGITTSGDEYSNQMGAYTITYGTKITNIFSALSVTLV